MSNYAHDKIHRFPPNYQTSACPPFINITQSDAYAYEMGTDGGQELDVSQIMQLENVFYVGRTMFETDRLPAGWDRKLNIMDEVWVPTKFHADIFSKLGNLTDDTRVWQLPQSVNTSFYAPNYTLSKADMVRNLQLEELGMFGGESESESEPFVFVSVFKWEERKGWKYLLRAYLSEFAEADNVELLILTNAYHTTDDFDAKITEFIASDEYLVEQLGEEEEDKKMPSLHVVPSELPNFLMPQLYQLADVFVLPSRGEGWGRPHVCTKMQGF